ncbi:MAG: class I SAM-dependent methyltransferase [Akkermansiaceae bacterium]|nr:class I SAM-dependent methyltransferase [Akkermansiaceae bacterium]
MYDQLEARLHDVFWAAEGDNAELPLIKGFLQQYAGSALELGCGSGRILLPLLADGYLMEGLDNSEDMLRLCRESAGDFSPVLHHAGMEDFRTGSVYGAVTIPAFTLQLLPPDTIAEVFANIRDHLHPGGGLYLTTFIPWAELTGELEEGVWFLDQETELPDGNTAQCHTRFYIKRLSQELLREHRYQILSPAGEVLESSDSVHKLTWFWPREIGKILTDAGFSTQQIIGDFTAGEPCDDNSQMITVIARRHDDE